MYAQGVIFGVGGGFTAPLGDASNGLTTGGHLMATVGYDRPASPLGVRADGMYHIIFGANSAPDLNLFMGTGNVVYNFLTAETSRFHPYVIGGAGIYNFDQGPFNSTDFGLNAGAGVKFNFRGLRAFAEARFHDVFTDGSDFSMLPISVGVLFGGGQ